MISKHAYKLFQEWAAQMEKCDPDLFDMYIYNGVLPLSIPVRRVADARDSTYSLLQTSFVMDSYMWWTVRFAGSTLGLSGGCLRRRSIV